MTDPSMPSRPRWAIMLSALTAAALICVLLAGRSEVTPRAGEVIELPVAPPASVFLGPYAEYIVASPSDRALAALHARNDWRPVGKRYIELGPPTAPIWLRARVRNIRQEPITVRLDTRRVSFEEIAIVMVDAALFEVTPVLRASRETGFANRAIPHRYLAADVTLPPGAERWIYIRYVGVMDSVLPVRVAAPAAFERADKHEIFWSAFFYGSFACIIVLLLITSPLIGAGRFAAFLTFLGMGLASVLVAEGYLQQFVVPEAQGVAARVADVIPLFTYSALLALSRVIFQLSVSAPRFDMAVLAGAIGVAALALFHLVIGFGPQPVFGAIVHWCQFVTLVLHLAVAAWAVWRRRRGGTAFFIAAAWLLVSSLTVLIDPAFAYPYGGAPFLLRWLLIVEASAFAAAITQQVLGLRAERDAAIRADLAATKEKLRLASALRETEREYRRAQRQAGGFLERLHSVSHDMLQPLSSLRAALSRPDAVAPRDADLLAEAFDYLEALARENMPMPGEHDRPSAASAVQEPLAIVTVLESVAAMFRREAEEKGLSVGVDVSDRTLACGQPVVLMRAVSNLVANAIRYTDDGSITLRVAARREGIAVQVSDTGRGMSEGEIAQYRARHEKSAQSPGSGLGLDIVRDAVEQLGGRLDIASAPGEGTTVTVLLPRP